MTKYFYLLMFSTILIITLLFYLSTKKGKKQLTTAFKCNCILLLIWFISLLSQIIICENNPNINPIFFDYIAYIGICYMPVSLLFTSIIFTNTKIQFKKLHLLFFIIPLISLIILWSNNYHHLFYKHYSISLNECIYGPYMYFHFLYTYSLFIIGLFILIRYSIKNSGFFSKQSVLIEIGILTPVIVSILGSFGIINMSIYITPISFSITVMLLAIAIFKFNLLSISPIALQKVVDRMSDCYVVLSEDNIVTDFNKTFIDIFNIKENIRNKNINYLLNNYFSFSSNSDLLLDAINKAKNNSKTYYIEEHFENIDKYFNIEVNSIINNNRFIGTLVLLKDVTQHTLDIQTIQENQDLLIEKERLASLGQMIGGIAHNLKTPIMSIAGAVEGLNDLITEYDSSIGDPEVTDSDHHEIAKDMKTWTDKIKTHTGYMSDVITAVKGQAVTLSNDQVTDFTVEDLLKQVTILMRHELNNALINLNIDSKLKDDFILHGNINSLVQVINNMISNAIQAYNGERNKDIDLCIYRKKDKIIISIRDFGIGMSKEIQDSLFKKMVTTKGKNGTGLGLFMSYSNIRAHFNGNITFSSIEGEGTTFYIYLPNQ